MKKIIFLIAAVSLSFAAVAQEKSDVNTKYNDGLRMAGGRLFVVKDGNLSTMDNDLTLANGAVVTNSGLMKMNDGKTVQLNNGELISMDGSMLENRKKIRPKF